MLFLRFPKRASDLGGREDVSYAACLFMDSLLFLEVIMLFVNSWLDDRKWGFMC